ncbi:MAG: glycosyltransferase family 9 protein, partial [Candidatus Marinimicrobia bacterium]|nr:glycosyltransferase family 9 protein [Candidatus Neomarinimicrobiota bacterium]
MKQQIFNPKMLFIARLLSKIISPFFKLFSSKNNFQIEYLNPKKILITEYNCIGDVILITPAINLIKKKYPNAKIHLVVIPTIKETIDATNLVDKTFSIKIPWHNKFSLRNWKKAFRLIKILRKENYDLAIDFNGDIRNNFFLWRVKAKFTLGFNATGGDFLLTHSAKFPFHKHQLERAIILLKKINIETIFTSPSLKFTDQNPTQKRDKHGVVIHPGANHKARLWPEKYWLELIEKLINKNVDISVVIPPGFENFENHLLKKHLDIDIFKGSIYEFAIWLKDKTLLIGCDSMAVHLATSLNVNALALFGSQNPELTKPYGKFGYFVKANPVCKHKRKNWRLCEECMKDLKPDMVMEKVNSIINLKKVKFET